MIQLVWLTLLAVHTGASAVWWWLMPHGFPDSSTELWVNQVLPLGAVVLLLTTLFARGRFSAEILPPVLAMIPSFWMAFGISSRIVFFESFRSLWNLPFLAGALLTFLWVRHFRLRLRRVWPVPVAAFVAAAAGWAFPGTQRAAVAATAPAGAALAAAPHAPAERKLIKLSREAQLHPDDGRVVIKRDRVVLNVQPLPSFADRSPDRCWTALAPPELNLVTKRSLVARELHEGRWSLYYRDEDASTLEVTAPSGAVQLDARWRLPRPIYSHLASFAELTLQGHKKLTVSFSPVPQQRVEIAAANAPARFAYLDAAGVFHVAQASERQRGPFTELAAGALARTDPLVLTLYDDGKAIFVVTFDDWAAQASTQLSPTAGWGVPVNAIELQRGGELDSAAVLISLVLADSSIGRGTQSVGHVAGVYRDRITVKLP